MKKFSDDESPRSKFIRWIMALFMAIFIVVMIMGPICNISSNIEFLCCLGYIILGFIMYFVIAHLEKLSKALSFEKRSYIYTITIFSTLIVIVENMWKIFFVHGSNNGYKMIIPAIIIAILVMVDICVVDHVRKSIYKNESNDKKISKINTRIDNISSFVGIDSIKDLKSSLNVNINRASNINDLTKVSTSFSNRLSSLRASAASASNYNSSVSSAIDLLGKTNSLYHEAQDKASSASSYAKNAMELLNKDKFKC